MQLTDAIKYRTSTKKFDGKKPDWKKLIQAVDLARFVPMAGNEFSLKFILIENEETIQKITDACQQEFVKTAGAILVVVSDRNHVKKMYDHNDKGFAAQQAGSAIQSILLALTEKKIDSCWVGFFDDNLMKEATEVPGKFTIEAIIPIGFNSPLKNKQNKQKPKLENVFYFESWGNKKMEPETRIRHDNV